MFIHLSQTFEMPVCAEKHDIHLMMHKLINDFVSDETLAVFADVPPDMPLPAGTTSTIYDLITDVRAMRSLLFTPGLLENEMQKKLTTTLVDALFHQKSEAIKELGLV